MAARLIIPTFFCSYVKSWMATTPIQILYQSKAMKQLLSAESMNICSDTPERGAASGTAQL